MSPSFQKRVLVVDDDQMMRQLVGAYLKNEHCSITYTRSAEEALLELQAQQFDLIISDRDMPGGMAGTVLAEKVKTAIPNMPFILMSGSTDGTELNLACVDLFLAKPFTRQQLIAGIVEVMPPPEDPGTRKDLRARE